MTKRNIDDVLNAIAAAHAETRGRILDQIDHATDAETAGARRLVSITLQEYSAEDVDEPKRAESRLRKEMERVLGGAPRVAAAFRAFTAAQENEPDELTAVERALAEPWVGAVPRAHAAGVEGLGPGPGAWFEVRSVKLQLPTAARKKNNATQQRLF